MNLNSLNSLLFHPRNTSKDMDENDFLINNPSITFFKKVYQKHTNFAIEQIEQTFIGNTNFGERLRCKIFRL